MRAERILAATLLLAMITIPAIAHDYVPRPPQEKPVLLRGGTVHTVSGAVLEATDVLFESGKITAIGRNLEAPAETTVIDLSGKHVYPGLIAPATVIGLREIDAVRSTRDDAEVGSITPEVKASVAYNPDSEIIPTVRSNGIAITQVAPGGSLLRGRSFITYLDGWTREDAGIRLEDGVWLSWPSASLNGPADARERDKRLEQLESQRADLKRAFDDARAYQKRVAAGEPTPSDLRWDTLLPVLDGKMPLYVAAGDYRQILEALDFAAEQQVRMVLVGAREASRAANRIAEAGVPVIYEDATALPPRRDDPYDQAYRTPAILEQAGVKFCIGAGGSWSARNLPLEAGHAVGYGLTPEQALRAITLSTAEILGIDDELGSLDVGKRATIVVSEGDIIDTLGHRVTHMWIDGREVDLNNKHKELWQKYQQKP